MEGWRCVDLGGCIDYRVGRWIVWLDEACWVWFVFVRSGRSFVRLLIHFLTSFNRSCFCSFVRSFVCSFVLLLVHLPIRLLARLLARVFDFPTNSFVQFVLWVYTRIEWSVGHIAPSLPRKRPSRLVSSRCPSSSGPRGLMDYPSSCVFPTDD